MSDDSRWAPPVDGAEDDTAPLPEPPAVPSPGASAADERWSRPYQPVAPVQPPQAVPPRPSQAWVGTPMTSQQPFAAQQPPGADQQWSSPARPPLRPHSPVAPTPRPRSKRRLLAWLTVGGAAIVIAALVLTPVITQRTSIDTEMDVGYSGQAASTGHPSSDWSRGASVAWTLPIPLDSDRPESSYASLAHGTTLIIMSSNGTDSPQLVAYDVAGQAPQELWRLGADILIYSARELPLWGDVLLVDSNLIDVETGAAVAPPWSGYTRPRLIGDVVVACDWDGLCTAWASPTEQLWQSQLPAGVSLSNDAVGEGDDQWVIIRGYSADEMTLLNVHTGALSSFEVEPSYAVVDSGGPLIAASDGWAVIPDERDSMSLLAPDGSLIETFDIDYRRVTHGPQPILGPRRPTIDEIGRLWRDEMRTWGDGLIGFTGRDCDDMVMNNQKISMDGINTDYSLSYGYDGECTVELEGFILSTDRSIGLGFFDFEHHPFFADSATGSLVDVKKTQQLSEPTLVFDDLLVGVTDLGVVALTPSPS